MSVTTNPRVSVLLVTYNQEKFVRQAMDSALMQSADFDFEVVVADDRSEDSTLEVLREYEAKDSRVRILPTGAHLGVTKNFRRGFDACRGEYVAVLEGDDYWITPRKLEALSDFLRRHPECPFCFHRAVRLEEETDEISVHPSVNDEATRAPLTASRLARGNFVPGMSACVYRRDVIAGLDEGFWRMKVREWPLNIVVAREGLIGYVPEVMSIYRAHPGGIWSKIPYAEKRAAIIEVIEAYNEYLEFEFDAEFRALMRHLPPPAEIQTGPAAGGVPGAAGGYPESIYRKVARRAKPFVPPVFLPLARDVFERARGYRQRRRG